MRWLIALVTGLALGAVGGFILANNLVRSGAAGLPITAIDTSSCAARIERKIAFTALDAQDVLSVQSSGPSCDNLVANITIRTATGHVVFAYSSRIDALMDPKINPIAVNGVKAVLNDYVTLADGGAHAALPEWQDGAPEISSIAPYGMFMPEAGNMLYRRVRDADAPLLRVREGRGGGLLFAYLPEIDESEQIARYTL